MYNLMRIESAVVAFIRHDVLCEMGSLWMFDARLLAEMDRYFMQKLSIWIEACKENQKELLMNPEEKLQKES